MNGRAAFVGVGLSVAVLAAVGQWGMYFEAPHGESVPSVSVTSSVDVTPLVPLPSMSTTMPGVIDWPTVRCEVVGFNNTTEEVCSDVHGNPVMPNTAHDQGIWP